MPVFLVAAIDGTSSRSWRNASGSNSHTYRFVDDCPGTYGQDKAYWHGPDTVATGAECPMICNGVVGWVLRHRERSPNVALIGHSRGGLVAICAARRLQEHGILVTFLGLYDAVDRHWGMVGEPIDNVVFARHARRDAMSNGSRFHFGNCGTSAAPGTDYDERFYTTTHGGVGGDVNWQHDGGFTADNWAVDPRPAAVPGGASHQMVPGPNGRTALAQAAEADRWIRQEAIIQGFDIPPR